MNKIVALAVLIALLAFVGLVVAADEKCDSIGLTNPSIPNPKLDACSWYNKDSVCCNTIQTSVGMADIEFHEICGAISKKCKEQLELLKCNEMCKPWEAEAKKVCFVFAYHLYESCKDDELIINGACKQVKDVGDASDFWANFGNKYEIAPITQFNDCISSGFKNVASMVGIAAAAITTIIATTAMLL